MTSCSTQFRLLIVTAALVVAAGACGPLGTAPPSALPPPSATPSALPLPSATPSALPLPSATPTQGATPEIFSPTAIPNFATPSPAVATDAPLQTQTLTGAPTAQANCTPPTLDAAAIGSLNWVAYCDAQHGFGFRYPSTGEAPDLSTGRFFLPKTAGTNLYDKYLDVTVVDGAATCSSPQAAGYEQGTIPTEGVSFNGTSFIKESGANSGAGNNYQWEAYSTLKGSLCVSMTFVLHSVNRMNFATPPPEFDQAGESSVFTTIMSTFFWLAL